MRLIYYSLYLSGEPTDNDRFIQLVKSIESLRRHNQDIRVQVHLFNQIPGNAVAHLESLAVNVIHMGTYEALIDQYLEGFGGMLSLYPVLHKFLTMSELVNLKPEQVLYLDGDTYLYDDIALLFDHYKDKDLYAREETWTRKNHFGYKPEYLDEDKLYSVAKSIACKPMAPFNSGVVMMNNKIWEKLLPLAPEYLSLVVRFNIWLDTHIPAGKEPLDIIYFRKNRAQLADRLSALEPIPYPSSNAWIKEQLALWLVTGKIPGLKFGFLNTDHALQGCEEFAKPKTFTRPIISHYYSHNTKLFYENFQDPIYKIE